MFQVAAFGCLLFLCLRATANSVQPPLPAEVTMNKGAGRGGDIIATLRLADGERLPFIIDTGTSCTLIDKSLEPKLGKCLGTTRVNGWDGKTYTNLVVGVGKNANILGLRFLARNLVTLDFPKRLTYLKQTSVGPLKR